MNVELQSTFRARVASAETGVADLYRDHFHYVWQVLQKLGVEAGSLDDATHDVFVVAHRRWDDFEGRSSPRTWLFSVARRLAHRYRRAAFRRHRRRTALALAPQKLVSGPDTEFDRKEAWTALLTFLDALDPPHREAFILGEVEGRTRSQMGHLLGISPNTAYSRLRAARRRFEQAFPDSQCREHVREASARPSHSTRQRGHALLLAHIAASRTAIGLGTVGSLTVLSATIAVVAVVSSSSPTSTSRKGQDTRRSHPAVSTPSSAPGTTQPVPAVVLAAGAPTTQGSVPGTKPEPAPRRERPTAQRFSRQSPPEPSPAVPEPTEPEAAQFSALDPAMVELAEARRALQAQQPELALSRLDRSRRLDVDGAFATERTVTRVWALCAAGRTHEANAAFRRLQRQHSASAYARVLSKSCVAPMINSAPSGDQEG